MIRRSVINTQRRTIGTQICINANYSILASQVYDNDDVTHAEAIKFTESPTWAAMIEGVSLRTGVEVTSLSIFPF